VMNDGSTPGEEIAAPAKCPFCESTDVATTSRLVTEATYWRCQKCGEIWNAGRLQTGRYRNDWRR